jgi:hypothetical protein
MNEIWNLIGVILSTIVVVMTILFLALLTWWACTYKPEEIEEIDITEGMTDGDKYRLYLHLKTKE